MKKIAKFSILILGVLLLTALVSCVGGVCGNSILAPEKNWVDITTYNDEEVPDAYLQPIWYTREVYDETVLFVGEDACANLLYEPNGAKLIVRNFELDVTYVEGKDYVVEGKSIRRIAGGNLPYFEIDEYFRTEPSDAVIPLNPAKCEFKFKEKRYLYHGSGATLTKPYYVTVSYTTDEIWRGKTPTYQASKTAKFIDKLKNEKSATILFYGDSITLGCNASGTVYGGNINPYLPNFATLVSNWLAKRYGADIATINTAMGGWKAADGLANFDERVLSYATQADLLVLGFGMNDGNTSRLTYRKQMKEMAQRYLAANPDGCVVLVSSMNPNTQSTWLGNQQYFEKDLQRIAKGNNSIAVAEVNSMFAAFENTGKRSRDWLANNSNHPNDFGVRVYAQVILQTLAGDEFSSYIPIQKKMPV